MKNDACRILALAVLGAVLAAPALAAAPGSAAPGSGGREEKLPEQERKQNQQQIGQKASPVSEALKAEGSAKMKGLLQGFQDKVKGADTQGAFDLLGSKELDALKGKAFQDLNPMAAKGAGLSDAGRSRFFKEGRGAMKQLGEALKGGRQGVGDRLANAAGLKKNLAAFDGARNAMARKLGLPAGNGTMLKDAMKKPVPYLGAARPLGRPLGSARAEPAADTWPLSQKARNYARHSIDSGLVKNGRDLWAIKPNDNISRMRGMINTVVNKYSGMDPKFVEAVMRAENPWGDPARASESGARGLMQFMPATARSLGINPLNPEQSVAGGTRYLKQLLETFGGDEVKAVAAYNAGPGAVQRAGGVPQNGETPKYVGKVLNYYLGLRNISTSGHQVN